MIAGHKGHPDVVKKKGRKGRRRRLKGKPGRGTLEKERPPVFGMIIGKYLSGLRKLDHVIVLKAGFEAQLRASRLSIPFGMRALGMTRQRRDGRLQRGIQTSYVPALQGLDQVA